MSIIADRLRLMRVMNRWSQRQVAEKIGYSTAALNSWENGKCSPNAEALALLVGIYDCSADYVLGISDVRKGETEYGDY